jgi:hypothetical protein
MLSLEASRATKDAGDLSKNLENNPLLDFEPPISLDKFIAQSGLSAVTVWRYRRAGWLNTPRHLGVSLIRNGAKIIEGHHCFAAISRQLATAEVVPRSRRLTPPAGFSWELGKGCSPLQILSQIRATSPLSNSFSL